MDKYKPLRTALGKVLHDGAVNLLLGFQRLPPPNQAAFCLLGGFVGAGARSPAAGRVFVQVLSVVTHGRI
jgi:hypothetical protein